MSRVRLVSGVIQEPRTVIKSKAEVDDPPRGGTFVIHPRTGPNLVLSPPRSP